MSTKASRTKRKLKEQAVSASAGGVGYINRGNGRADVVCADKSCHERVLSLQVAPQPKVESPFVFCDFHGKQHSYLICKHVLEDTQPPLVLVRATDDHIGSALCSRTCDDLTKDEFSDHKDEFSIICAGHLNDKCEGQLEKFLVDVEEWKAKCDAESKRKN